MRVDSDLTAALYKSFTYLLNTLVIGEEESSKLL